MRAGRKCLAKRDQTQVRFGSSRTKGRKEGSLQLSSGSLKVGGEKPLSNELEPLPRLKALSSDQQMKKAEKNKGIAAHVCRPLGRDLRLGRKSNRRVGGRSSIGEHRECLEKDGGRPKQDFPVSEDTRAREGRPLGRPGSPSSLEAHGGGRTGSPRGGPHKKKRSGGGKQRDDRGEGL